MAGVGIWGSLQAPLPLRDGALGVSEGRDDELPGLWDGGSGGRM